MTRTPPAAWITSLAMLAMTMPSALAGVLDQAPAEAAAGKNDGRTEEKTPAATAPRRGEPRVASLDLDELNDDRSVLRGVIERYSVDRGSLSRALPPAVAPERDARLHDFTRGWLDRLGKLDFDALDRDGRVDYLLFKNHLEHELRQLDIRSREREEAARFTPYARIILDLDRSRRDVEILEWPKVAGELTRLTREVAEARRALEGKIRESSVETKEKEKEKDAAAEKKAKDKVEVKRAVAVRAVALADELRSTLQGWYRFYDGYDPLFDWWIQEPYKAAEEALRGYGVVLRDRLGVRGAIPGAAGGSGPFPRRVSPDEPSPAGRAEAPGVASERQGGNEKEPKEIVGKPIGRAVLMDELAFEMVPYTPEELIRIAETELAWCEVAMKAAARDMGCGDDWRMALERVKSKYVDPGKQPRLIRDLAFEAIDYLDAHDLVTVPPLCRDGWRIIMMSPERQLVNPFFTMGGEAINVSFPASTMAHEAKLMSLRGNNAHFARATVFHEVIPGHHLQSYMSARHRTYRGLFSTPFSVEGWALYWELLLWDRGFARSPEDKVGMLFWRMHRCARIIFSLKFHLEEMSPQECIEFLVGRVGHERDNATAEVRRSFTTTYGPLYQAAYLLGGLQFHALHRELVESGKMTDRAFHDAILKENRIPVEVVRALLTGQELTRDHAPSWRFSDAPVEP